MRYVKPTPVRKLEAYQVIIRCIWERGPIQSEAFNELNRRGLWLSPDQLKASGRAPA